MRIKNSLTNILTGLAGQVITTLVGFLNRTVFIYVLGSTYLGVSGLFSNILTVLSFAELGIGQAIIFSLYKPIAENDEDKICSLMNLYEKVYRILFVIVLFLGAAILPFLPYIIKDIDSIPNIRIIYLLYVANSAFSYLFSYRASFVTACQKNYVLNLINILGSIILAVLQIIALLVFRNYMVYLTVQITFSVLQSFAIHYYAGRKFPFLRRKDIRPLEKGELNNIKKNVGALIIYKIGTLALNSTDNIIISSFVGIVAVGLYSNYLLLQSTVTGFLSTIFSNLTASIGNLNAQESDEKKLFMFNVINMATFWFYTVCSVCLFVCMTPFIHVWIGDQYVLPTSVSLIIAVNTYIGGMLFAPFNYRQTMGLFVQGKLRPIISAIINIVVSIWFAKIWGLAGVLWGTAVARLTTNAWFDPYLVFKHGLHASPMKYMKDYAVKAIEFVIIGAICTLATVYVPNSSIVYVFVKAIIAFGLSNLFVFLLYFRSEEFGYLFSIVKNIKGIVRKQII